ncbi:MAG: TIGR02710 family CRISPR-associated CARF protein, partial [Longimicrobiales bacterium]
WLSRGAGFKIVADYTGGTKTMSASLALWARRWPCRMAYVGGKKRTREGVGIVVPGSENTLSVDNPWDTLGYQAVEDASAAFDAGDFVGAAKLLEGARNSASNARVKRELMALLTVVESYSLWDRFRHKEALKRFRQLDALMNDLRAVLSVDAVDALMDRVNMQLAHLRNLAEAKEPTNSLVLDLLANAKRRASEGRFDDAVARLYRTTEALAQIRLYEYGLDTSAVPLSEVPDALRNRWVGIAMNQSMKLGLQDAFDVLSAKGDSMGRRFVELGLSEQNSPLAARNRSILAHGWQPISKGDYDSLCAQVFALAGIGEADLPEFPRLATRHQ